MNKRTFLILFVGLCCLKVLAQKPKIQIIIRGDDMGFSHSANEALIKSYKDGIETSIEIIVPFARQTEMNADIY